MIPNNVKSFDLSKERDNEKQGYVTPILETREMELSEFGNNPKTFIVVK